MSILNVENLNFSFGDKVLLKDVSFRLLKGDHAGLVGANGTGKTTFFNILTGKLIPDEGKVYKPPSVKIGYLDQHSILEKGYSIRNFLKLAFKDLYAIEKEIIVIGDKLTKVNGKDSERLLKQLGNLQDILYASDFYSIDRFIDNVANGLGLDALGLDTPVEILSGGQRTKVKLAKLLLEKSDLLLLDEPTNYLDKEHIDWLGQYLIDYPNSYMIISHDTNFLNKVTNIIYHIEFTHLNGYPGNYNNFLKLKDEASKKYIDEYNRQQKKIARLEDFISKNIARASTSNMAKSRRKQLEKIDKLEKPKSLPKPIFNFLYARDSADLVFESSNLDIGYNYPLIRNLNLSLRKGEKIAITGCNGIGKSTLLKTIMGIINPISGSVKLGDFLYPSYFEQESKVNDNTPLTEVWGKFPDKNEKEIRSYLAKCGLKQEHILQSMAKLSGGERSKVKLCKLMMTKSNWLLLDEPTNHLDVNAKIALKEALKEFNGTILLVCHEKEFYQDWITDTWNMEDFVSNTVGIRQLNF